MGKKEAETTTIKRVAKKGGKVTKKITSSKKTSVQGSPDTTQSASEKLVSEPQKEVAMKLIDEYHYDSKGIPITISIFQKEGEFVPIYDVSISSFSKTTEIILEKIRKELIKEVSLGISEITDMKKTEYVEDKFKEAIEVLIYKYFPDIDDQNKDFLTTYLIQRSLGLGHIDLLMDDNSLEEIAVNGADDPIWVYHRKHKWLKTSIVLKDEDQIKHYATMLGRKVGRQVSILEPLLDAHLNGGDRVNATLSPISTDGNTITLRKFSRDPWTITNFIESKTISAMAAANIWLAMQFELSAIIVGGTASGKTSMLNNLANFFPPNQRIISIEDTREIRLPKFLHWVPMSTRTANTEGKGRVSMEDLLVNSLRMRPDRILVGEIRRKEEAETLFEAIHTGHSCYATFHANSADEAVKRITNPPIEVPKTMMPAISLLIVQFRNRRSGTRRTFQIAEVTEDGDANVLQQYDFKKDVLVKKNESKSFRETLELYTGYTKKEIENDLKEKENILKYMVKQKINTIDRVGFLMANYYTNQEWLMKQIKLNKLR